MPTVLLSNFAGAGAQFFDNNGNVLSGGKIYTYQAGTSTPATTYTDSAGSTAHANPIILNSAGRVSTGEIWLVNASSYKFILKDSSDVTIATYDNILAGLANNTVTTNMIVDGAVTTAKILDANVTPAKLSAGAPTWTTGGNVTVSGTLAVTGTSSFTGAISGTLASTVTGTTQAVSDNSTKIATTAYVDRLATAVQIQPLTTTTPSGGAFTVSLAPTYLMFRSNSASSGITYTRQVSSTITLNIPSGSSFGLPASGATLYYGRIAIIAIDNGGSVVLAAANASIRLDESNLITTTLLSGSSSSASVYYSNPAIGSSCAYRVVGYVDAYYTSAGGWQVVQLVQGAGGNALSSLSGIGNGQIWASASITRTTTYYNTTGRPIAFSYYGNITAGFTNISCYINGVKRASSFMQAGTAEAFGFIIVPVNSSYMFDFDVTASCVFYSLGL